MQDSITEYQPMADTGEVIECVGLCDWINDIRRQETRE